MCAERLRGPPSSERQRDDTRNRVIAARAEVRIGGALGAILLPVSLRAYGAAGHVMGDAESTSITGHWDPAEAATTVAGGPEELRMLLAR